MNFDVSTSIQSITMQCYIQCNVHQLATPILIKFDLAIGSNHMHTNKTHANIANT